MNLVAALSDALDGKASPRMIDSYLRVVRHEAIRFSEALVRVRDHGSAPESHGETPRPSLLDVVWLVEVHRGIERRAPVYNIATACSLRAEANDRGIFWHGCRETFPSLSHDDQVGLYVDVIAPVCRQRWSISIKAGWGKGKLERGHTNDACSRSRHDRGHSMLPAARASWCFVGSLLSLLRMVSLSFTA